MRSSSRHFARIFRRAAPLALLAAAALNAGALAAARHSARQAGRRRHHLASHATRSLRATDQARLRYVSASGATLYETGRATGTLPGGMQVHMTVAATFTGTFTIHAPGGTIRGRGRATPHGSGTIESFAGRLTVTGGSGRYAHASGRGGLYGTFNRNDYALSIKTTGTLHY